MSANRQRLAASLVAQKLSAKGVTISHSHGLERVLVDGQVAVDIYWRDGQRAHLRGHWKAHRQPVRAHYGGYHFRSRNELRIAALLDCHGIKWKYELRHFDLSDGEQYLPDFFMVERKPGLPALIEVKDQTKVRGLAEQLGMPQWDDELGLREYEIGPIPVEPDLLSADLRKPCLLAREIREEAWVLPGKTSSKQPYVAFLPDGTVRASRACPLFADRRKVGAAWHVASCFSEWPHPSAGLWYPESVASVIVDFLETEGWVES